MNIGTGDNATDAPANGRRTGSSIPQWLIEQCFRLNDEGSNLRNLNLNIRRLNFVMMEHLSSSLKDNKRIESVNLTSSLLSQKRLHENNNDDERRSNIISPLASAVREHVSLKTLHLSYNGLWDATPLKMLALNQSSLADLYLDHNRLGIKTAIALAHVIRRNTKLTVLQLNSNRFGDEGGKVIADALKDNTCLKFLGLRRNSLMSETGHALLQSLEFNRNVTLVRLQLDENPDMPPSLKDNVSFLVNKANRSGRYLLQRNDDDSDSNSLFSQNCEVSSDDGNEEVNCMKDHSDSTSKQEGRVKRGLWPLVLERCDDDTVYFFLVQKPSLICSRKCMA